MDIASLSAISGIENISKYADNSLQTEKSQSNSLHDLMVAQQKANVSLQYTVAVKNTAVEAYRSIMNMQI